MADITAKMVKNLREKTDLPMMECKQALVECTGDLEQAIEWLKKKHKGKLAERADRATGEGRVAVYINEKGTIGGIVELQCETAPVAKNDMFIELADAFARKVADGSDNAPKLDDIRNAPEMDEKFTDVFGRLRESMKLASCRRVTGSSLWSYVHHDGKSGVLLALDAAPTSEHRIGPDLCMHALFTKPLAIDRSTVPQEQIEKVRASAHDMATSENKPPSIVEKIVEGKVNAFFAERVLVEQFHIKSDDYGKVKVGEVLKGAGVSAVTDLVVMLVGG